MVTDRLNGLEATRASLLQGAVSSLLNEDSAKAFKAVIDAMNSGV